MRNHRSIKKMDFLVFSSILLVTMFGASGSADKNEAVTSVEPLARGNRSRRLVGGKDAFENLFLYYASLEHNHQTICGGAIIAAKYVVTAASCGVEDITKLRVRAGSHRRGSGGSLHRVEKFMAHHDYKSFPMDGSNIAVIKVDKAFDIGDDIEIIDMFSAREEIELGSMVNITSLGNEAHQLQELSVPVEPCNDENTDFTQPPGTFCAGYSGRNICSGDSGAPATIGLRLAGIVSHRTNCGRVPGFITKVGIFREWVERMIYRSSYRP